MTKNVKRFFSLVLVLSMLLGLAMPAAATETDVHVHTADETEVVSPEVEVPVEEVVPAEEVVPEEEEAPVEEETPAEEEAPAEEVVSEENNVEYSVDKKKLDAGVAEFNFEIEFDLDNILLMTDGDVEIDEEDPAIIAFESELDSVKVLNADGDPVPLTEEQKAEALGMYQQYLAHWDANTDVLGLQTPFFLSFNDSKDDGYGILGEMLALAGVPVDAVRYGYMTYDDLTGMILNFMLGDQLGVQLYGAKVEAARDEVLALVANSGAQTDIQKMLIINDWLAHKNTFDMPYIMNEGKDVPPMVAADPQDPEYYDIVYGAVFDIYEDSITKTFEDNIRNGLKAEMHKQFYIAAIEAAFSSGIWSAVIEQFYIQGMMQQGMDEATATAQAKAIVEADAEAISAAPYDYCVEKFGKEGADQAQAVVDEQVAAQMAPNQEAINADPVAFVENAFGAEAAAQFAAMWEQTWADWEANGIPGMVSMFTSEIWPAIIKQFYIQGMMQQYGMDEATATAQAEQIMAADADAIAADPYGYCVTNFGEEAAAQAQAIVNDELSKMGINGSTETNPDGRVHMAVIVALQMDTPQQDPMLQKPDGSYMTPNEAVPVFADQAAVGLAEGIIKYWKGSHFGALGFSQPTSVCLGYTRAFTYLVQCLRSDIYGVNGAGTDMSVAENWKKRADVYSYKADGSIDIDKNYVIDSVRISFETSVTMFGETDDSFNSDHYWNAVKVDGKWYYVDPCYIDVFTEVMSRDRVETDGQMSHLYFMFSHTAAEELYSGNYNAEEGGLRTLYAQAATDRSYEDAWISRIKSNTYFNGGYAYYMYDSSDMLTMLNDYNNMNQDSTAGDTLYKIVRHKLTAADTGDGDTDYQTLVEFNYTANEDADPVARVLNPATGSMVENDLLTELYAKHANYAKDYPSLAINAALYSGKMYFNIANCILSYDIASGAIAMVKEYNTVQAKRDPTKAFGGVAFNVVPSGGDFTVENHPIAGMTIKGDGKMYVSVATNFAFISGKADRCDPASEGLGYAYEESHYNSEYNSYMDFGDFDDSQLEQWGYTKEINDNDEFMWTANFVETLSMSHLTGSHTYASVSVEATCGVDAFTENRCTTCGAIETDTRVYQEGTALEHHYVEFHETFYTKDKEGNWNTGICYVCTICADAVTEPKKPTGDMATEENLADYEVAKAKFDVIKENAGHVYVPVDATWAEDESTITFTKLECENVCPARKNLLDCLIGDKTITITLESAETAEVEVTIVGSCEEGLVKTQKAAGEVEVDGVKIPYEVKKVVTYPAEGHDYKAVVTAPTCIDAGYTTTTCVRCGESTITDPVEALGHTEETVIGYAATCTVVGLTDGTKCSVCEEVLTEQEEIPAPGHTEETVQGTAATCTQTGLTDGVKCSVCKEMITAQNEIPALGHTEEIVTEGTAATCTEAGMTDRVECSVCHEVVMEQKEIPALGHNEETVKGKEATCTENGLTDGAKCSVCGETVKAQETIPALGHTEEVVKGYAATCTVAGLSDGAKCSICDVTIKEREMVPALGHTEEIVKGYAATCTVTGMSDGAKCSVCGEEVTAQKPVPALGHTEETIKGIAATCTETGLSDGAKCAVCDEIITEQKEIPALGHTEEIVTKGTAATCTEAGTSDATKCSVCDVTLSEQKEIPALGHTEETVNGTAATCTAAGKTNGVKCSVCDVTLTAQETIPALGHTEEAVKGTAATCTETGLTDGTKCTVCGEMVNAQETIPALGHDWDDGVVTKKPTKEETGIRTYTCSVCKETREDVISTLKPVLRISGKSRVDTALEVAKALKETLGVEKFDAVIVAIGDNEKFADALAGSYLANVKGAPILLYNNGKFADSNVTFIKNNLKAGGTVYILGGTGAIPASVEQTLSAYNVKRLSGKTRYETNLAILKEAGVASANEILIATGTNFADSLSASAVGLPLMLVNGKGTSLNDAQIEFLKSVAGKKITIIGGTGAVSAEIEAAIEKVTGVNADRISGKTRHNTSVLIAQRYFDNPEYALITYSMNFPDGLAGGPLAYALGAPLLLTNAGSESIANEYIESEGVEKGYVLGGTAAVSDETARKVFGLSADAIIEKK